MLALEIEAPIVESNIRLYAVFIEYMQDGRVFEGSLVIRNPQWSHP